MAVSFYFTMRVGADMEESVLSAAAENGIFALLFVLMLLYVLNEKKKDKEESKQREDKLHGLLERFSEKYDLIIDRLERIEDKWR